MERSEAAAIRATAAPAPRPAAAARQWLRRLYVPVCSLALAVAACNYLVRSLPIRRATLETGAIAGLTAAEAARAAAVTAATPADPRRVQLLYVGNSQALAREDWKPGDLLSAQWLQLLLDRQAHTFERGVDVHLGALPGLGTTEMFVKVIAACENDASRPDLALLGMSPESFRKLGVRDEVAQLARDPATKSTLRRLAAANPDLPEAGGALEGVFAAPAKAAAASAAGLPIGDRLEQRLQALAGTFWRFFREREAVQRTVVYDLMHRRNRLLGISTAKARPLPDSMYRVNFQLMQMLARYAEQRKIRLVLYFAPLRPKEPNPYTQADRARLGSALAALCAQHGFAYLDYVNVVPERYYVSIAPDGRSGIAVKGEPDFVHFTGAGHKLLAERLAADLIPAFQAGRMESVRR